MDSFVSRRLAGLAPLVCLVAGAPVHGAGVSYRLAHTLVGGDRELFAISASGAGDVNGDGHDDLIVRGDDDRTGAARIFSGLDGSKLFMAAPVSGHPWLGNPVSLVRDGNADGFDDLLLGDPNGSNVARVLSGVDASELFVLRGPPEIEGFGGAVSALGDLNRDGVNDMIVGSVEPTSESGAAKVFSGADGSALFTFMIEDEFGSIGLGSAVKSAGDVDNDGVDDVIVGARLDGPVYLNPGAPPFIPPFMMRHPNGSARVFSGADGSELYRFLASKEVPDPPYVENFGYSVAGAGDFNADGYDDVIVGTASLDGDPQGPGGYAQVFSGFDGAVLHTFLHDDDVLDTLVSVDGLDDINADGFSDVLVASMNNPFGGSGSVRVYSGADGSVLFSKTYDDVYFLLRLTAGNAGDVNADGLDDFIVGVPQSVVGLGFAEVFVSQIDACPADLTGDAVVDGADLGLLLAAWGLCESRPPSCAEDFNNDLSVDGADLGQLLAVWGPCAVNR
jgi:hypothetical protein